MYELCKNVLEKVSFDKTLFRKELAKAIKWSNPDEKILLEAWCRSAFGQKYEKEITEIFRNSNQAMIITDQENALRLFQGSNP